MDFNTYCGLRLPADFSKQLKRKKRYSYKLASLFLQSSYSPAGVAQDASIIMTAGLTLITLLEADCALISETSSKNFWCEAHAAASLQTEQMALKVS